MQLDELLKNHHWLKQVGEFAGVVLASLSLTGCGRSVIHHDDHKTNEPVVTGGIFHGESAQDKRAVVLFNKAAEKHSIDTCAPSQQLAESTLTPSVRQQLGGNIKYNGFGAFYVNNNKATVNANVSSAPYVQLPTRNGVGAVSGTASALLNKTTRQYQNRQQTHQGAGMYRPVGFEQLTGLKGEYNHLYDRGHLIGYALAGKLKGFDASESNVNNICTQTAWANESRDKNSTGQNYYEQMVRKALDQNKTVVYQVTPIYDNQNHDMVPMGNHIQAKSKDGSLNFNVFVPNVQPGFKIDYSTGHVIPQAE